MSTHSRKGASPGGHRAGSAEGGQATCILGRGPPWNPELGRGLGAAWGRGLRPGAGPGPLRASGARGRSQGTVLVGGGPRLESGRTYWRLSADGKLYDAYVSYSDSPEDRKFVNFILKPQLERRRGYKLFLDARDLLPRAGTTAPRSVPALPGPRP